MSDEGTAPYRDTIINAAGRFGGSTPPGPPLQPPSGGGTFDGMEARVAKLEAAVEHIERDVADIKTDIRGLRSEARDDFRVLFRALITASLGLGGLILGLAGLMAKGFKWF